MNIYEIDRGIAACVDDNGEIIDIDRLVALQMDRTQKCENVACWIIDLEADARAISEQEKVLKSRREATERKAESLKQYLSDVLAGEKLKTARVSVSYRRSTAVEVSEDATIPEEYTIVKTTVSPNKAAIKDALRNGANIPGCLLIERTSIQIK